MAAQCHPCLTSAAKRREKRLPGAPATQSTRKRTIMARRRDARGAVRSHGSQTFFLGFFVHLNDETQKVSRECGGRPSGRAGRGGAACNGRRGARGGLAACPPHEFSHETQNTGHFLEHYSSLHPRARQTRQADGLPSVPAAWPAARRSQQQRHQKVTAAPGQGRAGLELGGRWHGAGCWAWGSGVCPPLVAQRRSITPAAGGDREGDAPGSPLATGSRGVPRGDTWRPSPGNT